MADSFDKTFGHLKRQNSKMTINKIWNLIKEGNSDELSQEEQKLAVIIMNHQEYQEYFENEDILDGSVYTESEGFNPFLHITLHQMAEDQLASESPVEVALLCESIEAMGYSRHEAIHVIIMILIHMVYDVYKNNKPFSKQRYKRLLVKCRKVKPSEMQDVVEREFTSN
ncbi:MAG: DUF1841 family protein [Candidatus Paceibacterota bacterium]|jgi:hypothetical protein